MSHFCSLYGSGTELTMKLGLLISPQFGSGNPPIHRLPIVTGFPSVRNGMSRPIWPASIKDFEMSLIIGLLLILLNSMRFSALDEI